MLLKRRGAGYYYSFLFKGMLISYCEAVSGRQPLFSKI
jgi:hypothetical protein